jgi:hypothetical protein
MKKQSLTSHRTYYPFVSELGDAIALVYEVMTYQTSAPDSCSVCGGNLVTVKQSLLRRVFCKPVFWCTKCIRTMTIS